MRHRKLVLLLGCMALAPLAVMAGDTPDRPARGEHWATLDQDGDGAISKAEAAAAPRMAEHFGEIDLDSDGRITKEEMQAARARLHEGMKGRGEDRFRSADTNGDGAVDLAELQQQAAERFKELDVDGNGLLTPEEFKAGMHKHRGERIQAGQPRPQPPAQ